MPEPLCDIMAYHYVFPYIFNILSEKAICNAAHVETKICKITNKVLIPVDYPYLLGIFKDFSIDIRRIEANFINSIIKFSYCFFGSDFDQSQVYRCNTPEAHNPYVYDLHLFIGYLFFIIGKGDLSIKEVDNILVNEIKKRLGRMYVEYQMPWSVLIQNTEIYEKSDEFIGEKISELNKINKFYKDNKLIYKRLIKNISSITNAHKNSRYEIFFREINSKEEPRKRRKCVIL